MNKVLEDYEDNDKYCIDIIEDYLDTNKYEFEELLKILNNFKKNYGHKYLVMFLKTDHWADDHVALKIVGIRKNSKANKITKMKAEIKNLEDGITRSERFSNIMRKRDKKEIKKLKGKIRSMKK